MDTADIDGGFELEEIGLAKEDFHSGGAETDDLGLFEDDSSAAVAVLPLLLPIE